MIWSVGHMRRDWESWPCSAFRRDRSGVIFSTCVSPRWGWWEEVKMTEPDSSQWYTVEEKEATGRKWSPGCSQGVKKPTQLQSSLLRGWSSTGTSCPYRFPEEVFPQLNLVNNSTGVLYLRATTSLFLKEHCLPPSKLQRQSAALTQSSQEQTHWSVR